MPLSVEQLLASQTQEQIETFLLDTLASLGFVTTSWQEGSVQRNIIEAVASLGVKGSDAIANIIRQVLVNPEGDWLDIRGTFFLQIDRLAAVNAVREITLTSAASSPPYVITPQTAITAGGQRFFLTGAGFTLSPAVPATVEVYAEFGGVAGNTMATPKVPGMGGIVGAWYNAPTTPGVDKESDPRYRKRQDLRLHELTYSVSLRAYELWALTAAPSVVRCRAINNYPADNQVRIVLDPGTPAEIALVEAYLLGRNPPNDEVTVQAANVVPYPITATPRVRAGVTVAALEALLNQVVLVDMPIGGWIIAQGVAGRLLREKLAEALLCKNGAYSAGIISPATDPILGSTDIIEPIYDIQPEVIP